MSQLLSLRHYHHEQIAHSHDHAQLVSGLSGRLEFEVAGRGCERVVLADWYGDSAQALWIADTGILV